MLANNIMNYYTILGVSQDAKYREIKAAYRRLALKYHPDRNSSPISENSIKIINAAFEVLSDRDKRRQYDEKAIYNNKANKKKDQTQSSSSSHVNSSNTVYSNFDRTSSDVEFHNTDIKGNRNETEVKSGKVSSLTNIFHKSIGHIHITIEPTLCMAFGSCEALAPNVFVVDKDKMINPKATLKSGTGDDFEAILAAAQTCPTKAIIIRDRNTGEQIYP
jgi:DnaJ-class molecular chaperone